MRGVSRTATTDGLGYAQLSGLIPGTATLRVTYDNTPQGGEHYAATRVITIIPVGSGTGQEVVDLDDVNGRTVRVNVFGYAIGAPERMHAKVSIAIDGVVRTTQTTVGGDGKPGYAEFYSVPNGPYVIWADNDGVMQTGEEVLRQEVAPGVDDATVQMSPISEFWDTFTSDGFRYSITVDGTIFRGGKTFGYQDPFNFNMAGKFEWRDYSVCCNLGARDEQWWSGDPPDGQQRVYGPMHNAGLTMRRKVWVSDYNGQGFVRYYDSFTNNTTTTQTYDIRIGSSLVPEVNGISTASTTPGEWLVRRNDISGSYPTWVEVFGASSSAWTPTAFAWDDRSQFSTYTIQLAPGETKAFLRVIFQRSGVVDDFSLAQAEAEEWWGLGARMLDNLSPTERASIVNFTVPF